MKWPGGSIRGEKFREEDHLFSSRCSVLIVAGDTSFLNLKVTPGGKKNRFSLDGMGYRLDFRDTKLIKSTDEEVVLSLNRLEHVFGTMRK